MYSAESTVLKKQYISGGIFCSFFKQPVISNKLCKHVQAGILEDQCCNRWLTLLWEWPSGSCDFLPLFSVCLLALGGSRLQHMINQLMCSQTVLALLLQGSFQPFYKHMYMYLCLWTSIKSEDSREYTSDVTYPISINVENSANYRSAHTAIAVSLVAENYSGFVQCNKGRRNMGS